MVTMKNAMFNFVPAQYASQFAAEGYVHIPNGVTSEFYGKMVTQVDEYMSTKLLKEFAIGDKQQARYDFPGDADYVSELFQAVGGVCGLNPRMLVLSERHIKGYEANAEPEPPAHKDRFASQIAVGISVRVKEGSKLVLFPYDDTAVNPFNASTLLRASLSTDHYPEPALKSARRAEIMDSPGDVIIFRGHRFWHLREMPALTTMLYLKLNAFNCDPLGEDPNTEALRQRTLAAAMQSDEQLGNRIPVLGRRVDYIHRRYSRDWVEVLGVVLWGEPHFTIDGDEFGALQKMDGQRSVKSIADSMKGKIDHSEMLKKFRRLAKRGVIDLVAAKESLP
jgi:hypothetical protein